MADHSKMHHCQHRLVLKGLFSLNEKALVSAWCRIIFDGGKGSVNVFVLFIIG